MNAAGWEQGAAAPTAARPRPARCSGARAGTGRPPPTSSSRGVPTAMLYFRAHDTSSAAPAPVAVREHRAGRASAQRAVCTASRSTRRPVLGWAWRCARRWRTRSSMATSLTRTSGCSSRSESTASTCSRSSSRTRARASTPTGRRPDRPLQPPALERSRRLLHAAVHGRGGLQPRPSGVGPDSAAQEPELRGGTNEDQDS